MPFDSGVRGGELQALHFIFEWEFYKNMRHNPREKVQSKEDMCRAASEGDANRPMPEFAC